MNSIQTRGKAQNNQTNWWAAFQTNPPKLLGLEISPLPEQKEATKPN